MKKKYKLFFIMVLSLFVIMLGACDNKNEPKEDKKEVVEPFDEDLKNNHIKNIAEKEEYSLVEGDKFNPFFDIDERFTFKSTNDKVLTVDEKGNVKAIAKGQAKVTVYSKGIAYAQASFNVAEKDKVNPNFNQDLYNEMLSKEANFDEGTISVISKVNGVETNVITKVRKSPFYYEMNLNGKVTYVKESKITKNKYFLFNVNKYNKRIEKEIIKESDMSNYQAEDILSMVKDIDYNKFELNKISDNEYNIKVQLKDLIGFTEEYLGALSTFGDVTKNAIVEMNVLYGDKITTIDINIKMHFIYENMILDMPINVTLKADYNKIEEFDTKDYKLEPIDSIEEVEEEEELDEFVIDGYRKYAYTYFEKGRYIFENTSDLYHTGDMFFKLYDENLNEVTFTNIPNVKYIKNIINIEKDGYYYIYINTNSSGLNTLKKIKLDDEAPIENELKSSKGEIKSKYDYNIFTYKEKNENEVLKIKNLSDKTLYLYVDNATTSSWYGFTCDANKDIYINPEENTKIYVISAISDKFATNNYEYNYQYDFSVESIINDYGTDDNNLVILDDETYTDKFMIGYKYKPRKAILKVDKKGLYGLKGVGLDGLETNFPLVIKDVPSDGWKCLLEPGEYEVTITTNDHIFDICSIKYCYLDISDKDVHITLNEGEQSSYYESAAVVKEQKIRYLFDLEKDSYLMFNPNKLTIYDMEGNQISPKAGSFGFLEMYFKLKAGSYYFMKNDEYYMPIYIGLYNKEPNLFVDLTNPLELIENEKYIIENENNYSGIFGKITATNNKIVIHYDNAVFEIYDENLNYVKKEYVNGNYEYKLNVGDTYYLLFKAFDISNKSILYYSYK